MKRVLGLGLLLVAAGLIGYGAHTVISNGNCSSTGYVQYGPVPKCSHGSEFLGISGLFFLGPAILLAGWAFLKVKGVTWPIVLAGIGVGALTIRSESGVASGAKSAGAGVAAISAALIIVSAGFTVRRLVRRGPGAPLSDASAPRPPTAAAKTPAPSLVRVATNARAAAPAGEGDAISKIARLARLRDEGVLTDDEFDRQKAKLLEEV